MMKSFAKIVSVSSLNNTHLICNILYKKFSSRQIDLEHATES